MQNLMFLVSLGSFFLAMSGNVLAVSEGERLDLNIMSFNVRYGTASDGQNSWTHRRDLVTRMLAESRPDVVGTQEALRFQLNEIREGLDHYGEVGAARDDGHRSGEYAAILYRTDRFRILESGTFWFSDSPGVAGSKGWGNRLPRICSWAHLTEKTSGKAFYFYNVHLDHRSQISRQRSVVMLAQKIQRRKTADPVLVTGDFNVGERNAIIRFLRGSESLKIDGVKHHATISLHDSFRMLHPKATAGTINLFYGYRFGPKIDFVLVPPDTEILAAEIVRTRFDGRYPSDHFPVTAHIALAVRPA